MFSVVNIIKSNMCILKYNLYLKIKCSLPCSSFWLAVSQIYQAVLPFKHAKQVQNGHISVERKMED